MANDLRKLARLLAGRHHEPTAAILDGRTIQSVPESGELAGYDGYKRKKGSKTHVQLQLGSVCTQLGSVCKYQICSRNIFRSEGGSVLDSWARSAVRTR